MSLQDRTDGPPDLAERLDDYHRAILDHERAVEEFLDERKSSSARVKRSAALKSSIDLDDAREAYERAYLESFQWR